MGYTPETRLFEVYAGWAGLLRYVPNCKLLSHPPRFFPQLLFETTRDLVFFS